MTRKMRFPKGGRPVFLALEENEHPISVSELCKKMHGHKPEWQDRLEKKRMTARVSGAIRHLHRRGFVWSPLKGYWTTTSDDSLEKFLGWIGVLADGLLEGLAESRSRTVAILMKFCQEHGQKPFSDDANPEAMRAVLMLSFLALLDAGDLPQDVGEVVDIALIDRAIVTGLQGNSRLSEENLRVLLPEIFAYVKRTASIERSRSKYGRLLTVKFLVGLARQCDVTLEWVFSSPMTEDELGEFNRAHSEGTLGTDLKWSSRLKVVDEVNDG